MELTKEPGWHAKMVYVQLRGRKRRSHTLAKLSQHLITVLYVIVGLASILHMMQIVRTNEIDTLLGQLVSVSVVFSGAFTLTYLFFDRDAGAITLLLKLLRDAPIDRLLPYDETRDNKWTRPTWQRILLQYKLAEARPNHSGLYITAAGEDVGQCVKVRSYYKRLS